MRPDHDRKERGDKKPKAESKISAAVRRWLGEVLPGIEGDKTPQPEWSTADLVDQAPKRWVVYEPMVLLPTGSFGLQASIAAQLSPWQKLFASVSPGQQSDLWRGILCEISPKGARQQLTHLAINEGIPLHVEDGVDAPENILRSPTGLRALYGDFGPSTLTAGDNIDSTNTVRPSEQDFARALWVRTRQNGIIQTWAPRWSMFSRGNVKEKARLLEWRDDTREPAEQAPTSHPQYAVDLYAGIGYFVFSYARRGHNVIGWELNPWSTEALRRGAVLNGWRVRIVRSEAELARPTPEVVFGTPLEKGDHGHRDVPQIVIFVEDNRRAAQRLAELRSAARPKEGSSAATAINVAHANCGLLPTSTDSWRAAWEAVVGSDAPCRGWLHLHENVGVADIDRRKQEIQTLMEEWAEMEAQRRREEGRVPGSVATTIQPSVEHVELVKTFAPGVWHCVFDVCITMALN